VTQILTAVSRCQPSRRSNALWHNCQINAGVAGLGTATPCLGDSAEKGTADSSYMQTVHGIRFMPVARIRGTLLGLDARWLGKRGLVLTLVLALATPGGPLSSDSPVWLRLLIGLSSVLAVAITSLGHELGHALAGMMAGLNVRAIVLAPEGGVTIRSTSEHAHVNFRTALAGPMANAVFGTAFAALALVVVPDSFASGWLTQVGLLQLLAAVANLLPFGPMDGANIVSAWRSLRV
jgi:Zn-dependent protease